MRRTLIVVFLAAFVFVPSAGAWSWPVDGPVLQKFVFGDDPYAAGQHRGIDIGAPSGEGVISPASGTVSFAGTVPVSGKSVTIQTADGYSVTLTHLGSISVRRGDTVREGAAVGTVQLAVSPTVTVSRTRRRIEARDRLAPKAGAGAATKTAKRPRPANEREQPPTPGSEPAFASPGEGEGNSNGSNPSAATARV